MKIRVLTAAIALAAFTATPALACSLNLTPRPGETETQAADRIYRSAQDRLWTEADVVFIGDVRSLQRSGGSVMVGVRPHRFLKGQASKALLTYAFADDSQFACSFTGFPNVITPGLFYARQTSEGLNVTGKGSTRRSTRSSRRRTPIRPSNRPCPTGSPGRPAPASSPCSSAS
jgi:hypothetical protein